MKKIAVSLLALVCTTRLFAQADDPGPPDQDRAGTPWREKHMEHRFWDRLHLTDDQRAKLHQIREADEPNIRSAWARVAIAREVLKTALLANPENTADVQAKATSLADALSATVTQMATHRAKINQVLTPEQRVALKEGKEHRLQHRWERHDGSFEERGERHGRGPERGEEPWRERRHGREEDQSSERTPPTPEESQSPATPQGSETPGTPNG
jgi:Spy/CpxP family protein refolding chaperone